MALIDPLIKLRSEKISRNPVGFHTALIESFKRTGHKINKIVDDDKEKSKLKSTRKRCYLCSGKDNKYSKNQGIPFEKIVKELRVEYDSSRSPLFQASINYHINRDNILKTDKNIKNLFEIEELDKFFGKDELNSNENAFLNDLNLTITEEKDLMNMSLI